MPQPLPESLKTSLLEVREAVWRSFFTNDQAKLEKLVPADTITIEPGGSLRKHPLATRNILGSLKRNLARQGVAERVTIVEGHSFEPEVVATVDRALDADQVGLLILDADADCKRDINRYGPKLMDDCWLIIDDYGGPADNSKVSPTKTQVDELVNDDQLIPLGYYGFGTWVGQWQGVTPPRAR
jgi:hypothetical protein